MANKVLLETSARHLHLSAEHIEILFGKGHELTKKKDLSQPGQFACEERVTVVGAKKELPGVSVLGLSKCFKNTYYKRISHSDIGVAKR